MSFSDALRGIVHVVRSERNMRIHLLLGLLVVIFAAALGVGRLELVGLMLTIGLVLVAELFNTVVEEVVDLITPDYHPLAGTIKNIAAGAVLVAACTAAAVGYLVFIDYLLRLDELLWRSQLPLEYLVVLILGTVIFTVLGWQASARRRGRPSLHTAVAFALAVIIGEVSRGLPVVAGFALALLVGQSRLEGKMHNLWEVTAGALLGSGLALIFLRLFY